jgi:hypothetical protein
VSGPLLAKNAAAAVTAARLKTALAVSSPARCARYHLGICSDVCVHLIRGLPVGKRHSGNSFTICVYTLGDASSLPPLLADMLSRIATAVGRPEDDLVGNTILTRLPLEEKGLPQDRLKRVPLIGRLRQRGDEPHICFVLGEAWFQDPGRTVRRPAVPPIEFDYSHAEPHHRMKGWHGRVVLTIDAALLAPLKWADVHALLIGIVELFEQRLTGIVSLFVELANRGKNDCGLSYGTPRGMAEDLQFRIEHELWRAAPLEQQCKLRGVFWGNYLSPAHLAAIPDAANLPKRISRWYSGETTPRSTCICRPTPGGGLWIELFEKPCDWPDSQPQTADFHALCTVYNEFKRAGFFEWRSGIVPEQ